MDTRDRAVSYGVKSGHGEQVGGAATMTHSHAPSRRAAGWTSGAVALASYGGLIRGGIKMLPVGVRAISKGKASLKPHHRRPGADAVGRVFDRYREYAAARQKEK